MMAKLLPYSQHKATLRRNMLQTASLEVFTDIEAGTKAMPMDGLHLLAIYYLNFHAICHCHWPQSGKAAGL
jgi:hypothetical protein